MDGVKLRFVLIKAIINAQADEKNIVVKFLLKISIKILSGRNAE